jgi:hypothetical protein
MSSAALTTIVSSRQRAVLQTEAPKSGTFIMFVAPAMAACSAAEAAASGKEGVS